MKLASEWKAKMMVAVDHSSEVLGFLLLVAVFRLASNFDKNELQKLLDIVAPDKRKPELSQALRIANESPVKHIIPSRVKTEQLEHTLDSDTIDALSANCLQLSTTEEGSNVNEHDSLPNEVSAALLVSPDPAEFVLDFIQESYSENHKKGSTNMEEGSIRIYILLLEQLKYVLPKINPQVKAQATKLAVEWKSKMRLVTENFSAVLVFLLFLAVYELLTSFDREEILKLLFHVAYCKQAPEICRALGFADLAPASNIYKEGNNFLDTKCKAIGFEVAALRALIECLEECKLESLIGSDHVQNCIVELEKQKTMLNHCLRACNPTTPKQLQGNFGSSAITNQPSCHPMLQPQHGEKNHGAGPSAPVSVQNCNAKLEKDDTRWEYHVPAPNIMTLQQLQGKNCNFGISTRVNQPTSGPVFYQQSGEQNYTSSASGPGNQLHQQNSQNHPQTDPYTLQVPAPVNSFAGLQGG